MRIESSPPTSIRDLPYELIEQIFAYTSVDLTTATPSAFADRATFLRELSLLARPFRYPAQAVLWSSVRVHSPAAAKRLLASPALGQFAVASLDLVGVYAGVDGLSGTTAARVLAKLRGVQWLRLADFGRLSARVLQNESLAGLKHLELMSTFPDKPATLIALSFPFHLRSLSLFNRSYPTAFLQRLFAVSAHSLRSLTLLTSASSPAYTALVDVFPLVAPNLQHLSLQHRPSPALVAQLELCTALQHLECHFAVDLPSVLDALPSHTATLRHLSLELDYNLLEVASVLVARLTDKEGALRALERLSIPRAPDRTDWQEFGGEPLLEVCRERGIRVEIGKAVAWRTRSLFD
ncbi:hypothetical protein JCM10213_002646 [Rhodosporidiobolus nylandii]